MWIGCVGRLFVFDYSLWKREKKIINYDVINIECKGFVVIKNCYFCDLWFFGNYFLRDFFLYCEWDVKKCYVLVLKWESMVEGF